MKRLLLFACLATLVTAGECRAGFLDELTRRAAPLLQGSALDDATVVKGLKEALATGTERAVNAVAKPDGYFGNQLVKISCRKKSARLPTSSAPWATASRWTNSS